MWKDKKVKEKLQNRIREVKDGKEGGEMDAVLDSRLNRFYPSNFAGLAHFLSGSFYWGAASGSQDSNQ